MSTDDLTARARTYAEALHGSADAALVSELADEVDRLRGLLGEVPPLARVEPRDFDEALTILGGARGALVECIHQRDAARAAFGRVTELLALWARLASQQANLGDVVHDLTRAIEGES